MWSYILVRVTVRVTCRLVLRPSKCSGGSSHPCIAAVGTLIFASDDVLEDVKLSRPCPAHPRQDLVS